MIGLKIHNVQGAIQWEPLNRLTINNREACQYIIP